MEQFPVRTDLALECRELVGESEIAGIFEHVKSEMSVAGNENHAKIKEMIEIFLNSTLLSDPCYKIRINQVEKYEETNEY